MRVLLRNSPTGEYFQLGNRWTNDSKLGHDFGTGAEAMEVAQSLGKRQLQMVFSFDDPSYDVIIFLDGRPTAREERHRTDGPAQPRDTRRQKAYEQ